MKTSVLAVVVFAIAGCHVDTADVGQSPVIGGMADAGVPRGSMDPASVGPRDPATPQATSDVSPAPVLPDAGADARATADVGLTSCHAVRECSALCNGAGLCDQRCLTSATSDAQLAYQAIIECSRRVCPKQDQPCRCETECYSGGQCALMVSKCDEFGADSFCHLHCGL